MARRSTAAQMTALVARWRTSGEPQARFARRHGVRPSTLWYWSRKLTPVTAAPVAPTAAFVPVRVTAEAPEGIEVLLASGDRVRVPMGASVDLVRTVVAALRSSC
jgi:transposase-like protein